MHADLATRRRVLQLTYQRYLAADRALEMALREVRAWLPDQAWPSIAIIGNPGSNIRRLFDQRERTVAQLEVARQKLEVARQRLARSLQETPAPRVLQVTYVSR